jgi:hypothetical protein
VHGKHVRDPAIQPSRDSGSSQSAIPPESSGTLDGIDATILKIRTAGLLCSFVLFRPGQIRCTLSVFSSRIILNSWQKSAFQRETNRKRYFQLHIPLSVYIDLVESRPGLRPSRPDARYPSAIRAGRWTDWMV